MKRILILISVAWSVMFLATPALAAGNYGLTTAANKANYDTSSAGGDIYAIVERVISAALSLFGFVFFGLFVLAGIRWMTARGNEEFISKARETMLSAIYGLIIVLGAYALTNFIFGALGK